MFINKEKESIYVLLFYYIDTMDEQVKQDLQKQIDDLKSKLTGDMFQDMEIRDQIHNLEMKRDGIKPTDSHIDCIGCGS